MIKFPLRDLRAECGETTEMYRPRPGRLYFGLLKHVGSVADSLELGTGVVEGNVSRFQPGAELGEGRLPLDFSEPPHLEVMLESVIEFAESFRLQAFLFPASRVSMVHQLLLVGFLSGFTVAMGYTSHDDRNAFHTV